MPEETSNILLTPEDFDLGVQQLELHRRSNQQWQQIYHRGDGRGVSPTRRAATEREDPGAPRRSPGAERA